jgi:hypothetical protein
MSTIIKTQVYLDEFFEVNMFEDFGKISLERIELKNNNKIIYPTNFIYNKSLKQRVLKQFFLNYLKYYSSDTKVNQSYESLTFIQLLELYKCD